MATDQEIRDRGFKYIPQQKYLQNPYNLPIAPVPPTTPPGGGGITNTNAFNNSGGNNFSSTGNAFGYGSPVSEVNVRTFNPRELPGAMTSGGQNANTVYNQAFKDLNDPSLKGMSNDFVGKKAQDVMDYANESIMDYRQNYGAQGQYNSPYEDSIDLGYQGTLGNNEMYPSEKYPNSFMKGKLNRFKNTIGKAAKFAGGLLPFPLNMATKFLPQGNDNGPGGGTYGIGGLSDAQKEQYNTLAGQGMLFNGQNGMKTLTGKNFTGKGYLEGQLDIYNKKGYDKYTVKEDDVYDAKGKKLTGFLKKQYQEASAMYKTTQKQKKEAEEQKKQEEAQAAQAAVREKEYASQGKSDPNDQSRTGSFGRRPGSGGNVERRDSGPDRNTDDTGQTYDSGGREGFGYGLKEGGRAGYFFGGRVNYKIGGRVGFKNGGLASIL